MKWRKEEPPEELACSQKCLSLIKYKSAWLGQSALIDCCGEGHSLSTSNPFLQQEKYLIFKLEFGNTIWKIRLIKLHAQISYISSIEIQRWNWRTGCYRILYENLFQLWRFLLPLALSLSPMIHSLKFQKIKLQALSLIIHQIVPKLWRIWKIDHNFRTESWNSKCRKT